MEQAITQLAVKILFDGSTGFDEIRRVIILPEKLKYQYCYMTSKAVLLVWIFYGFFCLVLTMPL